MWREYTLAAVWNLYFLSIAVVIGLIILTLIKKRIFLATFVSFLVAFILPGGIVRLIHLTGILPSGHGSLGLPNNIVDWVFVLYYILPIPLSIPLFITVTLNKNFFSKKFINSKK